MPCRTPGLVLAGLLLAPSPATAQQFVTDDAAIVDRHACQVEAWYAAPAAWVLPACQISRDLEVTAGLGWVEGGNDAHEVRYVMQAKTLLRRQELHGFGLGAIAGLGLDPLGQVAARRVDAVFAYVPLSVAVAGDRLVLHQNVGWAFAFEADDANIEAGHTERRHALTWGMRVGVALIDRVAVLAELFGQSRLTPEYQAGVRITLVPERLLTDISYTAAAAGGTPGAFAIGLAWTPPAWLPRGRP
jgi:hypothetical protein